jgi:hypothetical protein
MTDSTRSYRLQGFFFKFPYEDNNNKLVKIYVDSGTFYEHGYVQGYSISFHQDYIIANDVDVISNDIFNAVYYDMTVQTLLIDGRNLCPA